MQHSLKILCVDDEPQVLEGMRMHLRKHYTVLIATGGAAGLDLLDMHPDVAVVLSDMRMPEMDGAKFLGRVRKVAPNAVRMLLTGYTDTKSAVAAVNEGQIFRFLTKPIMPQNLLLAFESAIVQYRLVTAEKVLLRETLVGSVEALLNVLSLTNPTAFGRAMRLKELVKHVPLELDADGGWAVEAAAMLSQLGCATLADNLQIKLYEGEGLSQEEQARVNEAMQTSKSLLTGIPRLEPVLDILAVMASPVVSGKIPPGARALRIANDFDLLKARGYADQSALDAMRAKQGAYDGRMLDGFAEARSRRSQGDVIVDSPVMRLKAGMVLVEDLKNPQGVLILPRGFEITEGLLGHIRKFQDDFADHKIKVKLRAEVPAATAVGT